MRSTLSSLTVTFLVVLSQNTAVLRADPPTWKVGTARAKITPEAPMYLAGFGGRSGAAEGTLLDIWAKTLVLEAADGNRAVVFTTDVCGVSRATYLRVCDQLHKRFGLRQSQVLLTYSHTHTGPALHECLQDYCDWDAPARTRIKDYTMHFEATLVNLVAEALGKLEPVTLCAGQGQVGFGVAA